MRDAFLLLGHLRGVPIRAHLTLPLGLWLFSGLEWDAASWAGLLLIVLVHELGHAWAVRGCGAHVVTVNLLPTGGECAWVGQVTPLQRSAIASGGVAAQGVLALGAWLLLSALGWPVDAASRGGLHLFLQVLVFHNLLLAAFNLIPIAPLDGFEAVMLVPRWVKQVRARARRRALQGRAAALSAELDALAGEEGGPRARPPASPPPRTWLD
jgi:membrane-associated protease RseP (regulator of RpoE activity)